MNAPVPSRRAPAAVGRLDELIYRIIAKRRAGDAREDLLGTLLATQDDDGARMSDRQLRDGDVGGRCRRGDAPCDSGLRCEASAEPRCVASVGLGATCELHRRCGVGLTCGREGRCVPAGSLGSRCEARCDPGLACRTTEAIGFCANVVGPWARCEETSVCADGLFCRHDQCEPELGQNPGVDGGLCRIEAPFCDEGLRCERSLHCERAGGAQVGEGCDEVTRCEAPSTCFNRLCREVGRVGGACRDSAPPCEAGLFCDGERCQMSQAPGSACVTPRAPCAPGHTCVSVAGVSRCTADGQTGARCRFDSDAICDEGSHCVPGRAVCLP